MTCFAQIDLVNKDSGHAAGAFQFSLLICSELLLGACSLLVLAPRSVKQFVKSAAAAIVCCCNTTCCLTCWFVLAEPGVLYITPVLLSESAALHGLVICLTSALVVVRLLSLDRRVVFVALVAHSLMDAST